MQKAKELGLICFSSPFDETAVDFLETLDVPMYKIASFENNHLPLIRKVSATGKPVIVSTGASTLLELDELVTTARDSGCKDLILLKCTSSYPASPVNSNILTIPHLRNLFDCEVGLSDHTFGHATVLGAIAIGATVFEKHFTDDNERDGPDHKFSMNPNTWKDMIERSKELYLSLGSYEKKIEDNELQSSLVQRRILRFTKDLSKNHVIQKEDVFPLRPMANDGIEPYDIEKIIGKKIKNEVKKDDYIRWKDLI